MALKGIREDLLEEVTLTWSPEGALSFKGRGWVKVIPGERTAGQRQESVKCVVNWGPGVSWGPRVAGEPEAQVWGTNGGR